MASKYFAGFSPHTVRIGFALLALSPLITFGAPPPAWWAQRGATSVQLAQDPTAAANLGQLKRIASKARDELQASLPGGAGAEIDALITSFGVNLTQLPGVTTSQSSTYYDAESHRAVDNNTDGNFSHNSIAHTWDEASPWMQVDLGAARIIQSLEVWNRVDCCQERTSNFYVFVSDSDMRADSNGVRSLSSLLSDSAVWHSAKITVFPSPSRQISLGSRSGRYVMVRIEASEQNKQFLALAEFKVRGVNPASAPDPEDFALTTSGRVKAISKLFYDRLATKGYPGAYPWTGSASAADDTAVINIGQLKKAFSFDLTYDQDGDGVPNWWELSHGGNPTNAAVGAPDTDGDGVSDYYETFWGRNPNSAMLPGTGANSFSFMVFTPLE